MRRPPSPAWIAAAVLVVAADARADRAVETWVGTWTGKASWKGCTAAGGDAVEVSVGWRDGALWIDGARVYDGLGDLVPEVRDRAVLVYQTDDLTVELRPPAPAAKRKRKASTAASLTMTTAAHCTLTARLVRDGTGIAACDELVALGTAATSCQIALDADPRDEIDTWRGLSGKQRTAAGASCRRRADAARERLLAADCIPPDHDPGDLPACRQVWTIARQLMSCERAPVEYQQRTMTGIASLRRSLRTLSGKDGGDDYAASLCVETEKMLRDSAELLGCL
jgi:hypothetical protein